MSQVLDFIIQNWEPLSLGVLNILQFFRNASLKKQLKGGFNA